MTQDEGKKKKPKIRPKKFPGLSKDVPWTFEAVEKLNNDLLAASKSLKPREIRFLVDGYYQLQDYRVSCENQLRAARVSTEPMDLLEWIYAQTDACESQIKKAMDIWTDNRVEGRWAKSIFGIAEVLSAGVLAYFDIEQAPTVGRFWRIAGLDPTIRWLGREGARKIVEEIHGKVTPEVVRDLEVRLGNRRIARFLEADDHGNYSKAKLEKFLAKRPWNGSLKVLCWKIGDSFCRQHGQPGASGPGGVYCRLYAERKALEVRRNDEGKNKETAERALAEKRYKDSETKECYLAGKLPPGRLDLRARRWAVKIFLSHLHEVMYWCRYQQLPPKPFAVAHLGHTDRIPVPNMDMVPGLAEAWKNKPQ